jgi:hypothetical protein
VYRIDGEEEVDSSTADRDCGDEDDRHYHFDIPAIIAAHHSILKYFALKSQIDALFRAV